MHLNNNNNKMYYTLLMRIDFSFENSRLQSFRFKNNKNSSSNLNRKFSSCNVKGIVFRLLYIYIFFFGGGVSSILN